jgi:hypothetical protein
MTVDELWAIFTKKGRDKAPMTAACFKAKHAIASGHAYGIIRA